MCFDLGIGVVCGFNALCCVKSNCWCLENWKRWRCDTWVYFATLLSGELFGFCLGDWSFVVEGRLICCGKMSLKSIVRELKEMRRRRGKVYSGAESPPPAPPQKSNLRNRNGVASMNRIQKSYFSNNVAIACCRKRSVIYWRESSASTHTAPYFLYRDTWHSSFLWA